MRFFKLIDDWIRRLEAGILIAAILLIALNSIINVFGRYMFGQSLYFSEELNYFLIIAVTFIGSSYAARQSRHISMSAFVDILRGKNRAVAMIVINLVTACLLALLAWYAVEYLMKVSSMGRLSPALRWPLHLVYIVVPIGLGFTAVQFLRHTIEYVQVFQGKREMPAIYHDVPDVVASEALESVEEDKK